MSLPPRKKYDGRVRRLLLAFDIGTTYSGISYSILDPGKVPDMRPITRFPSQEKIGGDSKIPTEIYYDSDGKPQAFGAETLKEGIEEDADDEGWFQAKWFKLHLRPSRASTFIPWERDHDRLPQLPPNKTVLEIFADYMRYLNKCAKEFISDVHGPRLWSALEGNIMYILTHPNGWEGPQQKRMRMAAAMAGLIPDTDEGRARITFVTEGEASLHFCLLNGLSVGDDDDAAGVMIVDAGGGTIDVTSYRKTEGGSFEEIGVPICETQGAAYVTMRAHKYFEDLLDGSKYANDARELTRRFDQITKHRFSRDDETYSIQFLGRSERNHALKIRNGRITFPGTEIAKLFEPSVDAIVKAIKSQISSSSSPNTSSSIKSIFLVGGFSANTWLYEKVKERVSEAYGDITVSRPDAFVNKAVSNGAVSFYLDHAVTSRVARLTYGALCNTEFDRTSFSHRKRAKTVFQSGITGQWMLPNFFSVILPKATKVTEAKEFRRSYVYYSRRKSDLHSITESVDAYKGATFFGPKWRDDDELDKFGVACRIRADTSAVPPELRYNIVTAEPYYTLSYDIVLKFGLTELKAQLAWIENGREKRGPATVVYDD